MGDRRSEILSAAERLVRGRGYSGFSYADLSETIGIRKPSIHHHFSTKEELVLAVLEQYRLRYADQLALITKAHANALDQIEAYGKLYLEGARQGLGCLCAALNAEREVVPAALNVGVNSFFGEHLEWLSRGLAEGQNRGDITRRLSATQGANLILATLEGALLVQRAIDGSDSITMNLASLRVTLAA
ncbi:TetR/AcrR family transcriptional regulator [Pseudomonas sp. CC120222-01a]|uniref:TetR/AcrR family transcriptional regulator n=1 Tax=Pseudomonas sp. CC120222-01a TaxID=1378075 RepID=UPI000D8AA40E|nr:TetR/AcrR family transcriptional regulator [Pseudomonas sp. CC120222-01a]PVZ41191.1 TetR family transcriptional regulator [Pseudomonas sp. CC120222-01a]